MIDATTDPMKALRDWCGLPETAHLKAGLVIGYEIEVAQTSRAPKVVEALEAARALLAAAPTLLARLEAGEGLLREARDWLASMSMQQGRPSKALLNDIDAIDAFLAAKGADRG